MPNWTLEEIFSTISLAFKAPWANRRNPEIIEESARYGPLPPQYLLFLRPEDETIQRDCLVFFVHGGAWRTGSPAQFRFVGQFFAALGFPTILAGYRLAPKFKYPAQRDDVSAAFRLGLKLARKHGMKARQVIGAGQSAGAHLVSLLAYDREELAHHQLSQAIFSGLALISGPLDFSVFESHRTTKLIRDFTGEGKAFEKADPIRYVQGDEPFPVLCLHGEKDPIVPVENSRNFALAVNRLKNLAEVHLLPEAHHADLTRMFLEETDATQILAGWLDEKAEGCG